MADEMVSKDIASTSAKVPLILYGTAFKEDQTTDLVTAALRNGFAGVDSAVHTKAYREKLVGEGIKKAVESGVRKRESIFIQTKFSPYLPGKDTQFFPYDVITDIETQVASSIESSLSHFSGHIPATNEQPPYLDCVILHHPYPELSDTLRAWRALESHVLHHCRALGLSNIDVATLRAVYESAKVKPVVVQNRFTEGIASIPNPAMPPGLHTPDDKYDAEVRKFCREHGILYQPWGLLWGNPNLLASNVVNDVAKLFEVEKEVGLYLCFLGLGGTGLLIGTTREERMKGDLEAVRKLREWLTTEENAVRWKSYAKEFLSLIEAKPYR